MSTENMNNIPPSSQENYSLMPLPETLSDWLHANPRNAGMDENLMLDITADLTATDTRIHENGSNQYHYLNESELEFQEQLQQHYYQMQRDLPAMLHGYRHMDIPTQYPKAQLSDDMMNEISMRHQWRYDNMSTETSMHRPTNMLNRISMPSQVCRNQSIQMVGSFPVPPPPPLGQQQPQRSGQEDNEHGGQEYNLNLLPPGYTFSPKDEEIYVHYLKKKLDNKRLPSNHIPEVNLYDFHPQRLTEIHKWTHVNKENVWYFFTTLEKKYPNGGRPNRKVEGGYWKASGKDDKSQFPKFAGYKRVLEFMEGKSPKDGVKTDWKMHEYRIQLSGESQPNGLVLCRLYKSRSKRSANNNTVDNCEESSEVDGQEETSSFADMADQSSNQPSHQIGDTLLSNQRRICS